MGLRVTPLILGARPWFEWERHRCSLPLVRVILKLRQKGSLDFRVQIARPMLPNRQGIEQSLLACCRACRNCCARPGGKESRARSAHADGGMRAGKRWERSPASETGGMELDLSSLRDLIEPVPQPQSRLIIPWESRLGRILREVWLAESCRHFCVLPRKKPRFRNTQRTHTDPNILHPNANKNSELLLNPSLLEGPRPSRQQSAEQVPQPTLREQRAGL